MTVLEKLKCALRYMFEPAMIAYWLGSAVLMFLAQRVLLSDAAQRILIQSGGFQINSSEYGQGSVEEFLSQNGSEIMLYALFICIITVVLMAKSLDSAKRISEGNLRNNDFSPVSHIGWLSVGKYLLGSLVIALVNGIIIGVAILIFSILTSIVNQTIAVLIITVFTSFAALVVLFSLYASTFVFLDTLSYRKMLNPSLWKAKIIKIGKGALIKVVLSLFLVSFLFGFALVIIDSIFGQFSSISNMISLVSGQFITMISVVLLGFFNQDNVHSDRNSNAFTSNENARLLYDADTQGMSDSEKQHLADDLRRADAALSIHNSAEVEHLLEPYTRNDNLAVRYYPAYQRLYHHYFQSGQRSKFTALRARIIRIAAQNHERFYQLINDDIFELSRENNAQFAANDIYPLIKLALAHNQPQTVLALAKDFRKRQSDHPDVVKVYTSVVKVLVQQHNPDMAAQVAEQIISQYPNHTDTEALRQLAKRIQ